LFSIGCGRVIEGTPQMMWQSLLKLRGLPDDTQIYCGHEYTQANIRFAKTIEPGNEALLKREQEVAHLRADRKPTIPSTMGEEKAANPFLRADLPELAKSLGLGGAPAWQVFAEIRERKNKF
jgi:hydroxyacylglutathione hydrolase